MVIDVEAALVLKIATPKLVIDLHGRLGTETAQLPGWEGIGW